MWTLTTDGRRRLLLQALQASDLGLFGTALAIYFLRLAEQPAWLPVPPSHAWLFALWLAGSAILWHFCLARADLYQSRRMSAGAGELWDVIKGTMLGTVFTTSLGLLLGLEFITPRMVQRVWITATLFTMGWRLLLRMILAAVRRSGRNLRLALFVGSGPRACRLLQQLQGRPDIGYRVTGYVDDTRPNGQPFGPPHLDLPHLGGMKELPAILAANVIDEVFVTLPVKSKYDDIAGTIRLCEEQGIQVRLPVDLFNLGLSSARIDVLEGTPVLALQTHAIRGWYAFSKRALDVLVSSLLLLVLTPLFLVAAWLIKRDSAGPTFFVQERVGLHKRRFGLIKFRTMYQDSESRMKDVERLNEATGPVFKVRKDPRVTRAGRLLRRTSIDELPQLINVLRGDMSLVGPRPLPVRDVKGFTEDWQRRRFSVKPGMTCLWQVSGRSSITFDQWMEMDMAYIDRSSLALDFRILLRTIPAVIRGTGAY
jgi:exopolysaccharide biosynthesis polyprenyl glycosylphosphotransferase